MYKLTLTYDERRAIDFVGHRFTNGDELFRILWVKCEQDPDDVDWDFKGEITFLVPEHVAWEVQKICDEEAGLWPCFSDDLARKMDDFLSSVV